MSIIEIILISFIIIAIWFVISISWTFFKGAPWVAMNKDVINELRNIIRIEDNQVIYDLGCGDGRVLLELSKGSKAKFIGIEIDYLRYLITKLLTRIKNKENNIEIINENFFKTKLSDADIVICFLLPKTNSLLEEKFKKELKPGTIVVSHMFKFQGLKLIKSSKPHKLYLYEI